jgi:hypothetical protein
VLVMSVNPGFGGQSFIDSSSQDRGGAQAIDKLGQADRPRGRRRHRRGDRPPGDRGRRRRARRRHRHLPRRPLRLCRQHREAARMSLSRRSIRRRGEDGRARPPADPERPERPRRLARRAPSPGGSTACRGGRPSMPEPSRPLPAQAAGGAQGPDRRRARRRARRSSTAGWSIAASRCPVRPLDFRISRCRATRSTICTASNGCATSPPRRPASARQDGREGRLRLARRPCRDGDRAGVARRTCGGAGSCSGRPMRPTSSPAAIRSTARWCSTRSRAAPATSTRRPTGRRPASPGSPPGPA